MRTHFVAYLLFVVTCLFLTVQANAQLDSVLGNPKKKLQDEITRRVGEALGVGAPLTLDQHTAFPAVDELSNFHPKLLNLKGPADVHMHLTPGDYAVSVIAFCTQWSIHAPGRGLPYKLAPVKGKQAKAVCAILVRGTLKGIAPATLNTTAWRIQSGLPLNQWPQQDQTLVHQLAPEYEEGLKGDYLQKIRDQYDKVHRVPLIKLPAFEDMLASSAPGKQVLNMLASRKLLADQTLAAERMPDMLYQPTDDGLPRVLPAERTQEASPWAEIRSGIFARFTVIEGNLGKNLFEFRITDKARQPQKTSAASNPLLAVGARPLSFAAFRHKATQGPLIPIELGYVMGILAETEEGSVATEAAAELIAYSERKAAQALILMLNTLHNDNANGGDDSGKSKNNGAIKNIGDKSMTPGEADAIDDALTHIDNGEKPTYGWKWGEPYNNDPTRGQELPTVDGNGNPINYKEYYVKPESGTNPPGSRRIVTGSDGSTYYTPDHYKTFWRLR